MRAVVCEKLGDPTLPLGSGVLRLAEDVPIPESKPGCIKVRVTAASLNFPDALQVKVGTMAVQHDREASARTACMTIYEVHLGDHMVKVLHCGGQSVHSAAR